MEGFRVRYAGSRVQLVCTTCGHVCEVEDQDSLGDASGAFARLHPAHEVPAQHAPDCPSGTVAAR